MPVNYWEYRTRRVLWALVAAACLLALALTCACSSHGQVGVTWQADWTDHRPVIYLPTTQPTGQKDQP